MSILSGLWHKRLDRASSVGIEPEGSERCTRVAVFAPAPDGGHPAYVKDLLDGVLSNSSEIVFVWPVRSDCAVLADNRLIEQPIAIPTMDLRASDRGILGLLRARSKPGARHDVGFLKWLRGDMSDVVLVEEHQRFTFVLFVLVVRAYRKRIVMHLHNSRRHDYEGSIGDWIDERLLGIGLQLCQDVVVHDLHSAEVVRARYGVSDVSVVPHGVRRVCSSAPNGDAKTVPTELGKCSVLFFGENRPNKGLAVLVDSLVQLSERGIEPPLLIVAGRTPPDRVDSVSVLLGRLAKVRWIDSFIDEAGCHDLFHSVDAVILPYTDFEAQSGVLHQSIAYGVPVVASDLGGIGEVVRRFDMGICVRPARPRELSDAIVRVCGSATNREFRLGAERARLELDWDRVGEEFASILSGRAR